MVLVFQPSVISVKISGYKITGVTGWTQKSRVNSVFGTYWRTKIAMGIISKKGFFRMFPLKRYHTDINWDSTIRKVQRQFSLFIYAEFPFYRRKNEIKKAGFYLFYFSLALIDGKDLISKRKLQFININTV